MSSFCLQSDEYASRLEGIASHLNEAQSAIKYDKRSLAQLLAGLQQFMEDALGINVRGTCLLKTLFQGDGWYIASRYASMLTTAVHVQVPTKVASEHLP